MNPAYVYIYDDFLSDRVFEREVAALETRLNTYDLAGRIGRLALFRSARDLVEGLVREGTTTVVVVGNDTTLDKTMWFLPDLDVTVGYVPLTGPSSVARLLGIPVGAEACDVLAARLVETIDMGRVDDRYFLTEISMPATMASLEIEGQYSISSMHGGSLAVRNLGGRVGSEMVIADAKDGYLEAVISPLPEERKASLWKREAAAKGTSIRLRHGVIVSKDPVEAMVDNHAVSGFRFEVSVVPKKLRIITGRGRRLGDAGALPDHGRNGTVRSAQKRPLSARFSFPR
ncbi:hypothetical protein L0Y59_04625 [Candidatus Uhrbacteria bacterium]|nr:hypothetical protein [Candidatus Uhrbacteria bacterium]